MLDAEFFVSLNAEPIVTVAGALEDGTAAGLGLTTRTVAADEGPDEAESDATFTDSADLAAVSSLIVLAALLTEPDAVPRAARDGARGGGISSASRAAFVGSITRGGREIATSL